MRELTKQLSNRFNQDGHGLSIKTDGNLETIVIDDIKIAVSAVGVNAISVGFVDEHDRLIKRYTGQERLLYAEIIADIEDTSHACHRIYRGLSVEKPCRIH